MRVKPSRVVMFLLMCLFTTVIWSQRGLAQQKTGDKPAVNPLVRLLQAKGVLTDEEVAQLSQALFAGDANEKLAKLLLMKGVISQTDYDQALASSTPTVVNASSLAANSPTTIPAVYRMPVNTASLANTAAVSKVAPESRPSAEQAAKPTVIPAIAPLRMLPVGPLPREAGTPGFNIGSVRVTPYGILKATFVHDSSSPNGDDFPLNGFIAPDTGPHGAPEFHVKARSSRIGTNLEWLDPSRNFTITGKFEADFEGNFSRADNRNISTARSNMFSVRLAYARLDYKFSDTDSLNVLLGQDWTPFVSSTLPNLLETTWLASSFGNVYERAPQIRGGWTHNFGSFQLMPEVAMVFPGSGDTPSAAFLFNQLGYGERQGADSGRPEVQGRIVAQFQLDHAPGVVPAQIIFSGMQGRRDAVVLAANVPTAFQAAFPHGADATSITAGWSGEFQLPTRYATLIGKYYSGSDLRFFFGSELFSNYNDTARLTGLASATSVDGASTVFFGTNASGTPVVAPERPVRSQGGIVSLGLPLSRLFGADPEGRSMGWSAYLHYGVDFAKARDVARLGAAGTRHKSPVYAATVYYKLNNWVTFAFEQSLYETYGMILPTTGNFPLVNGVPSRIWRDLRSEGGTIFTF